MSVHMFQIKRKSQIYLFFFLHDLVSFIKILYLCSQRLETLYEPGIMLGVMERVATAIMDIKY